MIVWRLLHLYRCNSPRRSVWEWTVYSCMLWWTHSHVMNLSAYVRTKWLSLPAYVSWRVESRAQYMYAYLWALWVCTISMFVQPWPVCVCVCVCVRACTRGVYCVIDEDWICVESHSKKLSLLSFGELCAFIEEYICISCSCSNNINKATLKAILPQFVPRMAHKWDSIGLQLAQAERVSQLRNSPEPNEKKMKDILDAWMESLDSHVLISSLSDILKSSDVGLHDVAEDFDEVCRLHTVHSGLGHRCTR